MEYFRTSLFIIKNVNVVVVFVKSGKLAIKGFLGGHLHRVLWTSCLNMLKSSNMFNALKTNR